MTRRERHFWIEVVLFVSILLSITIAVVASEMQPLNRSDIKLNASDLRSFASAGHQLIEQYKQGQLTETFFRSQIELLNEKVSTTAGSLRDTEAEPNAEKDRRDASDLAGQLEGVIGNLDENSPDLDSADRQISDLIARSKQLEDRLKDE